MTAPYYMRLEDLLTTYVPVYPKDGIWEDTVNYMLNDPVEYATVCELMRQYRLHGHFREPVLLESYGDQEIAEDDYEDEPLRVANGTHRVVASYLMGVELIYVQDDHPALWDTYDPDGSWHYASTIIHTEGMNGRLQSSLFDLLRSFPLDDDTWVTASVITGGQGYVNIYWDNEPTPEFEARYPDINDYILKTVRSHGGDLDESALLTTTEFEPGTN